LIIKYTIFILYIHSSICKIDIIYLQQTQFTINSISNYLYV